MRQRQTALDRIATLAALRLLAWVGKHVDPAQQLWLDALRGELDAIDGGIARLVWAVGGTAAHLVREETTHGERNVPIRPSPTAWA